jgi:hypothetical protein
LQAEAERLCQFEWPQRGCSELHVWSCSSRHAALSN